MAKKTKKIELITSELNSALDRIKLSDNDFCQIVPHLPLIKEEVKKGTIAVSRSTVKRKRKECRRYTWQNIQSSFVPANFLTVHWDGKLAEGFRTKNKSNRLAVSVSAEGEEKLLGVPVASAGTGEAESKVVCSTLQEWGVEKKVVAMCFDTTSSNTGPQNGVCVRIESILRRKLYWLACRHHVRELMITAPYNKLFNVSTGPDIELFKKFQNSWNKDDTFNKNQWESGLTDPTMAPFLLDIKDETIKFIKEQLKLFHPRDDYKEFLELSLLLFGEKTAKVFSSLE